VRVNIPLADGLALAIGDDHADGRFPTGRLRKGLLLLCDGRDLAEEGVGFGVPVVKRGTQTVFAGDAELRSRHVGSRWEVTATFAMNLIERLAGPGGRTAGPGLLYPVKDALAALHRRSPPLRGMLTATSGALRRTFNWTTAYERVESRGAVAVTYVVHGGQGRVDVSVDLTGLRSPGITEVVVMNEQGARCFDRYVDADGAAQQGRRIGTWQPVTADWAAFVGAGENVSFTLQRVPDAQLFRGRELLGDRVAWSGFGYALSPALKAFAYDVRVSRPA
jgi:hypothetical protein